MAAAPREIFEDAHAVPHVTNDFLVPRSCEVAVCGCESDCLLHLCDCILNGGLPTAPCSCSHRMESIPLPEIRRPACGACGGHSAGGAVVRSIFQCSVLPDRSISQCNKPLFFCTHSLRRAVDLAPSAFGFGPAAGCSSSSQSAHLSLDDYPAKYRRIQSCSRWTLRAHLRCFLPITWAFHWTSPFR